MARTAVQFGAGNIGRGFMAQLFNESGLDVFFVDADRRIVDAINGNGSYTIRIVGDGAQTVSIDRIRAVHVTQFDQIAAQIADAETEIVCTAVGAAALPLTAPAIAAGLTLRRTLTSPTINVLLCENLHDASGALRSAVSSLLPGQHRDEILNNTGFVQAVVSRMVPLQTEEDRAADPLAVRVEAYKRLPVDADAWVAPPDATWFAGFEPVSPFEAYVERKLFTHNCAHAVLGYLGYQAGHEYGYQALHDARIAPLLRAVLDETGEALIRKHGFAREGHRLHIEDLLHRFENRELGDTCVRLARDPIRKLASHDRIIGAARCCESQGVKPIALAWAIAAALRYGDPADPSAIQLQEALRTAGIDRTLERICGILPHEPLAALIQEAQSAAEHGERFI